MYSVTLNAAWVIPIQLPPEPLIVEQASKHRCFKKIIHLPCMLAGVGQKPGNLVRQSLGIRLTHCDPRPFSMCGFFLWTDNTLSDVLHGSYRK